MKNIPHLRPDDQAVGIMLNELIRINFDRIYGYEKASSELSIADSDLRSVFEINTDISRGNVTYWQQQVRRMQREPSADPAIRGKVFRLWMDLMYMMIPTSRLTVLNACISGEKAALAAYEETMVIQYHLPEEYRIQAANQKTAIQRSLKTLQGLLITADAA